MKHPRRIIHTLSIAFVIAAVLTGCATKTTLQKSDELEQLVIDMGEQAELLLTSLDGTFFYENLHSLPIDDTQLPSYYDLRDKGLVTPVKDQSPWGTCWAFSIVAASESSILSSLGMTTESYREKYQEELDLSERHLAWFTNTPLPSPDVYPEGECPFIPSQAGEGVSPIGGEYNHPLLAGSNTSFTIAPLSSGIGILKEKYAPYTNNEGTLDLDGDWSIPETDRFISSYELKDLSFIPDLIQETSDGEIIYRQGVIEAIKKEIMAGRAISVVLCADSTLPNYSKEDLRKLLEETLKDDKHLSEDKLAYYIDARSGFVDLNELPIEEMRQLVLDRLLLNDMPQDTYDLSVFDHDQLVTIFLSAAFGETYEAIIEYNNRQPYLSFIGTDPIIFAQYTYERVMPTHAVTIVGWDDSFSAENWPEGSRPPADGAWIVKNNWGEEWGNDGFFLISYYDLSLCDFATLEYLMDDGAGYDYLMYLGYDYMNSALYLPALFDEPVYAANVFETDEDGIINSVSVLTGDIDTEVTVYIYLLDEDATEPTQGKLLLTADESFRFAGYHRFPVNKTFVPEGSTVSIVVKETVHNDDGTKYAFICNGNLNEEGAIAYNKFHEDEGTFAGVYAKGVINPGESFIRFESGNWMDWYDVIRYVKKQKNGKFKYMEYDNNPIKIFLYPAD